MPLPLPLPPPLGWGGGARSLGPWLRREAGHWRVCRRLTRWWEGQMLHLGWGVLVLVLVLELELELELVLELELELELLERGMWLCRSVREGGEGGGWGVVGRWGRLHAHTCTHTHTHTHIQSGPLATHPTLLPLHPMI